MYQISLEYIYTYTPILVYMSVTCVTVLEGGREWGGGGGGGGRFCLHVRK